MIELEPILPLSTAHAPGPNQLDVAILRHASMHREEGALFYVGKHPGDVSPDLPEWLFNLYAFARTLGAVWLMLDRDAAEIDNFPVYDW